MSMEKQETWNLEKQKTVFFPMTIPVKTVFKMWRAVKPDITDWYHYGVYIEGFKGGASIYAIGRTAAYRKTVYGSNRRRFIDFLDNSFLEKCGKDADMRNNGLVNMNGAENLGRDTDALRRRALFEKTKAWLDAETAGRAAVDGKEFFQAVNCADAINRGEKERRVTVSARSGFLDLAAWTDMDNYGVIHEACGWSGAVTVNRKHLDPLKTRQRITVGFQYCGSHAALYLDNGEIECPLAPWLTDAAVFSNVLEYGWHAPEPVKPVPEQAKPDPAKEPEIPASAATGLDAASAAGLEAAEPVKEPVEKTVDSYELLTSTTIASGYPFISNTCRIRITVKTGLAGKKATRCILTACSLRTIIP
jgi:hypothetical protein